MIWTTDRGWNFLDCRMSRTTGCRLSANSYERNEMWSLNTDGRLSKVVVMVG